LSIRHLFGRCFSSNLVSWEIVMGYPTKSLYACCAVRYTCLAVTIALVAPLFMLSARQSIASEQRAVMQRNSDIQITQEELKALSIPWIENRGQWDSHAMFRAQSFAGAVWVTKDGALVHQFNGSSVAEHDHNAVFGVTDLHSRARAGARDGPRNARRPGWTLIETFVGGVVDELSIKGSDRQTGQASYLVGDESRHARDVPTYGLVRLGEVFPGVSVAVKATNANVEKLFTVAPRRDPNVIRMGIDGALSLKLGSDGSLIATTDHGDIAFTAPIAFQDIDGERKEVAVSYMLDAANKQYGFAIAAYDQNYPITIDPLLQSTYHGGSVDDRILAMAIHPVSGDVYVAGQTESANFPGAASGAQIAIGGSTDAFVSRFNAALTTRFSSTFLGGSGFDRASAIAIHPASGDVYIAGYTDSTNFPGVGGGAQVTTSGGDGFVASFDSSLATGLQSTYVGGSALDQANALAIHPVSGEVYVAGETRSTNFPGTAGGAQPASGLGTADAFVARFNAALTNQLQATYLGGVGYDSAAALAIHPANGELYVGGYTLSTNFPITAGSAQPIWGGGVGEGFVSKLSMTLSNLIQSTYLGGSNDDKINAIAIHPTSGDVYVVGVSDSDNFPGAIGGAQSVNGGGSDAFVSRFSAELTSRIQSTYLGSVGYQEATTLSIHFASGEIYIAGLGGSGIPGTIGGAQATPGGGLDAFVARFNASLTRLIQSSYLGGAAAETPFGLAAHPTSGEVYVAGFTDSTNFPGASGGAQIATGGFRDAFISRLSLDLMAADVIPNSFELSSAINVPPLSLQTSNPVQIVGVNAGVPISIVGGRFAQYCVSSSFGCACDVSGGYRNTPATMFNNQFVCVRQVAPDSIPAQSKATLIVGGAWADHIVTTGAQLTQCVVDVDGNGGINATTDGLLLTRAMLGMTGGAVTNGAIGLRATRTTWSEIRQFLNANCGTNFVR
jgi:hypothetical protein